LTAAAVLVSTCAGVITQRIPLAFHLMKLLARVPWFATRMRARAQRDPEANARRSIRDPELLARTLRDPVAWPLLKELQVSTMDQMARRLAGTENDIRITRATTYPLERIAVPTLVVHGTVDRVVPLAQGGQQLAARIPGAELVQLEGGDHVAIFTHHAEVRARVTRFLRAHVTAPAAATVPATA
jgi:pimeloyl-ACP methyl ester carboxylesterase